MTADVMGENATNTKLNLFLTVIGIISSFFFLPTIIGVTYSQGSNQTVYSTDSKPFGISYQEWIGTWWNWTQGIPASLHPRDDPNHSCNVNQKGPVWFLPDSLSVESPSNPRICDIPAGKAIFIPVITGEADNIENPNYSGTEMMKGALACDDFSKDRRAEIDGVSIKGLDDPVMYRTNSSQLFKIGAVENNIYNIDPGTGLGFADGWFLFIKPLATGEHKIHVAGPITSPDPNCNTNGDVTWVIRVK